MEGDLGKIAKACEPCRRRKIRCNGAHPCPNCRRHPEQCTYRQKARIRKKLERAANRTGSPATNPSTPELSIPGDVPACDDLGDMPPEVDRDTRPEVYHSITAAHHSPGAADSSQLFYGPSSSFAFLQQVHRRLLSDSSRRNQSNDEVQEGAQGLDLFLQRSMFFGTPSRIDVSTVQSFDSNNPPIPYAQARVFLDLFIEASHYRHPFFTTAEINKLVQDLYSSSQEPSMSPQLKAIALGILAIGALCTTYTTVAEILITQAKRETAIYDDVVTLHMVQFSLIIADYQIHLSRPTSTYLYLGQACRKAFALGLHKETLSTAATEEEIQRHRMTLWSLYFHETWQASAFGRKSALRIADISCPFPKTPSFLSKLCELAIIMEHGTEAIYGTRSGSLRQLYALAESTHERLREFAKQNNIGAASFGQSEETCQIIESLTLHNCYHHAILLTFRPFLIADSVLQSNSSSSHLREMWLRQACRHAIDAAQDSIVYTCQMFRRDSSCRATRYQGFFLESSCAVLFYDMLYHPSKYQYHLEYIQTAIHCMDMMLKEVPVTTAQNSLKRILWAVEQSISKENMMPTGMSPVPDWGTPLKDGGGAERTSTTHNNTNSSPSSSRILPNTNQGQMGFLGGGDRTQQQPLPPHFPNDDPTRALDPLFNFNLDIMTTDLSNFFPMNIITPGDTSMDLNYQAYN